MALLKLYDRNKRFQHVQSYSMYRTLAFIIILSMAVFANIFYCNYMVLNIVPLLKTC